MTLAPRLVGLVSGLLFGAGLVLSGMTRPDKVIGFLDLTGDWDPSLAFVMVGAIGVFAFAAWAARRQTRPVWAPSFQWPTRKDIDARLLLGSALFGLGWGLAGYCPGPAPTAPGPEYRTGRPDAVRPGLSSCVGS